MTDDRTSDSEPGQAIHSSPAERRDPQRNALSSPEYRRFTLGSICYFSGWWLQRVTIGWTIWQLSKSPLWLGVLGATEVVPIVLLSPFVGLLDRIRRITILRYCQVLAAFVSFCLAGLSMTGRLSITSAIAIFLVRGAINTVYLPAALAFAPTLIAKRQWHSAISVNSVVINLSLTLGPGMAGLILAYSSADVAYAISALLNLSYLLLLYTLPGGEAPARSDGNLLQAAVAGLAYALRQAEIRTVLIIFLTACLCVRSIIDLLSGFAGILPSGGPKLLSLLSSALGLGALLGAVWMSYKSSVSELDLNSYLTKSTVIMAVALMIFSSTEVLPIVTMALFVMGCTIAINGIATQTIIQLDVEEHLRGRLMAIYSIIFRGGWGLGAIIISWIADHTGLRVAGLMSAIFCIAVLLAVLAHDKPLVKRT
jgi:predicted MFS family arabinose efflux permease